MRTRWGCKLELTRMIDWKFIETLEGAAITDVYVPVKWYRKAACLTSAPILSHGR